MKRILTLGLSGTLCCFAVWSVYYRSNAQDQTGPFRGESPPSQLVGRWEATGYSVAGIYRPFQAVMAVDVEAAEVTLDSKSIRFLGSDDEKTFIEICGLQDEIRMGGGGPRRGICRINADGQFEILEARSASRDFPADFSESTKLDSVHLTLTRLLD